MTVVSFFPFHFGSTATIFTYTEMHTCSSPCSSPVQDTAEGIGFLCYAGLLVASSYNITLPMLD